MWRGRRRQKRAIMTSRSGLGEARSTQYLLASGAMGTRTRAGDVAPRVELHTPRRCRGWSGGGVDTWAMGWRSSVVRATSSLPAPSTRK